MEWLWHVVGPISLEIAERLQQGASKILLKGKNKKHRNNLTIAHINTIREIKHSTNLKVYPFVIGSGFVIMEEEDTIKKIEEQIGKSIITDYHSTTTLLHTFQKELPKLRKEGKFDNKTYYKVYPSDAIPPRLYGVVKAHKPEKNYLMRTIVSTIGTVPYGTSKYLVEIIQPTLNKNINHVIDSYTFVKEAKTWEIHQDEAQVSYDVVNFKHSFTKFSRY